jgi:hypothetical protein
MGISVTNTAHNLIVLREAQRTIEKFERTYGLTTAEMLCAHEDDERLAQIDGFELMDWHFAVDQKEALTRVVGTIHAVGEGEPYSFSSQYQLMSTGVLVNTTERELDLVA